MSTVFFGSNLVAITSSATDLELKRLASNPAWQALMHAQKNSLGVEYQSAVDSVDFFLSPTGKTNLQSELEFTINSFFLENISIENRNKTICRFPARYEWVRNNFTKYKSASPVETVCPAVGKLIQERSINKISLIFAESYLDNPASMFGHTFLRLENSELPASRLLDPTVSFAADSHKHTGFSMAWNGLFGGYKGKFYNTPYYVRVQQYADADRRDLWEYPLNLSEEEIRILELHLWELKNAYFDYYFIDENCSFQLLALLSVARPDIKYYQTPFPYVIPLDTIRILKKYRIISSEPKRRLSEVAVLDFLEGKLSLIEKEKVRGLADLVLVEDDLSLETFSFEEQIKILDATEALLAFEVKKVPKLNLEKRAKIAHLRSKLFSSNIASNYFINNKPEPLLGQDLGRLKTSYGIQHQDGSDSPYVGIALRPALHSLSDPDAGYLPNSELFFLEPEFRVYFEREQVSLERFTLVQINSFPIRKYFIKPFSWGVNAEFKRIVVQESERNLSFAPSAVYGLSYEFLPNVRTTLLASGEFYLADSLGHKVEALPGLALLMQWTNSSKSQMQFEGKVGQPLINNYDATNSISISQNYKLTSEFTSFIKFSRNKNFDNYQSFVEMGLQYYFSNLN